MRVKLIVILSCCCMLATVVLVAQDIPSDELFWASKPYAPEIANAPAIRVQSDLVEVATVVRDNHEKPVANLTKENFLLFDNGKPQAISTFSILTGPGEPATSAKKTARSAGQESPSADVPSVPRYIALFFDDANTNYQNLYLARGAALKFVRKGLDPGERVGIFTASGTISLDFTDDIQKLLATLATLRLFQRMPDQGPGACPPLTTYQAWVVVHFGAMTDEKRGAIAAAAACCHCASAEALAENEAESVVTIAQDYSLDTLHAINYVIHHLGQMPGRRILVLNSSGFLTFSFAQETQKVIETAVRAGVVINSLDTAGLPATTDRYGSHFNLILPLSDLALGTGGKFIYNNNDLEGGMRTLSAVPSVSYVLGFSPTNLKVDGSQHKLKVRLVDQNHLSVSARPAYYAPSPEATPAEKRFKKLQGNVMAMDNRSEIPIQFTATPETLTGGGSSLKILVHVDVRKLDFENIGNRKSERLIFITALFDEKNQFLTGVEGVMDLRLKDATMKQLSTQGLDAKLSIQAPTGLYRVRQVVQESVDGKLAAVNRTVEIR